MKDQVLALLCDQEKTPQEKFNQASALFRNSPGANSRLVNFYNAQGYSGTRLESLFHELKKLHGISEKDVAIAAVENKTEVNSEATAVTSTKTDEYVYTDESGIALNPAPEIKAAADVFAFAPAEVKTEIKLRDEFPFLKDENCPDKLLLLVGKKMGHYDRYCDFHAEMMKSVDEIDADGNVTVPGAELTAEEKFELAKSAVQNFVANQDIYDELNHYKATGEILGKHPIFEDEEFRKKLDGQTVQQVAIRKGNLINYIGKSKKKFDSLPEKKQLEETTKQVRWQRELEIVNEWLASHDKK